MALSLSVLEAYYPAVATLRSYLSTILDIPGDNSDVLSQEIDSQTYTTLLSAAYVANRTPQLNPKRFQIFLPVVSLREVIDRAQVNLLTASRGRSSNILTYGYRLAKAPHEAEHFDPSRKVLENHFLNTIITSLQGPEWQTLLERIGEGPLLHLLTSTSVFIPLPNDCLCQVTGEPIVFTKSLSAAQTRREAKDNSPVIESKSSIHGIKRSATDSVVERPPKRLKLECATVSFSAASKTRSGKTQPATLKRCTLADMTFNRSRMFYSWPNYIPKATGIALGLPPKHILNCINPSYMPKPKTPPSQWVDPNPRTQAEHARRLAKYVFPRQYGLSHPFVVDQRQWYQASRRPDFQDRELEIKRLGSCKTPKRLKHVLSLLDKMLWRHGKCRYKALLGITCPSKIKAEIDKTMDTSMILELMSEYSIQLRSQETMDVNTSIDSFGRTIVAHGLSQARDHARLKPRFVEFACTYTEVYRFAALVTNAVIPMAFWGCERNKRVIFNHMKTLITARRFETMTLHNVLQGFSVTECDWLSPDTARARSQPRVSVTDALKRRELLEEFLSWYFDSFLIPLLKTTFYITESSAFRNRILYFRQDDWAVLCAPLVDKLSSDTFQKLEQREAEEILRQRKLGFSFVRLLPKEAGVRPIVNLKRRSGKGTIDQPAVSINQILGATFAILNYEKDNRPDLLGASVSPLNDVYRQLKSFKRRLLDDSTDGKLPKLYFVKLDVQACFDTIEQGKLLEILREIISQDAYMVQKMARLTSTGSTIQLKWDKKAWPEDDHPHFLSYAAKLAQALRHTVFVDQVVYAFSKREEVLELLEQHITENIVKIGDHYYRQVVGIPQGSVISTLLCSFFYGDLERRHFNFTDDPRSLLMRVVDDYLFISADLSLARRFLSIMVEGHPEYGCFIAKEKTLTNFYYDPIMNITTPGQQGFPWCGNLINMTDLSVSVDYTRFHETYPQDSFTVARGRRPGAGFVHKMIRLVKARSHCLFCDMDLNNQSTVHLNIYQNFLVTAMKMHSYLRQWGINIKKSTSLIRSTIQQMIRFTYPARGSRKVVKTNIKRGGLQQAQVIWLGMHAFYTVLSRKSQTYPQVIQWLELELSRSRNRRLRKQFRGTVKEGLQTLGLWTF